VWPTVEIRRIGRRLGLNRLPRRLASPLRRHSTS
jgi:hypothetical protein